jgi:hypothetical protein
VKRKRKRKRGVEYGEGFRRELFTLKKQIIRI